MAFKFSIIVPVYNVQDYLEETIKSVIHQTIGFEENIQMILVNDGSPDESYKICEQYKEKYPNNIVYIEQENGGVSSARNYGLKYARGEYVNFLDSDDKWQLNACEVVQDYFEKHPEIDVIACMLEYFEAKVGLDHPLNKKFNKNKVINIELNPDLLQMHMASCFIRREAIDIEFDTNLKFAEDSLFINKIILKKKAYGALKSVHYLYRKRYNETSAIDTCQLKPDFYCKTLKYFHNALLAYSNEQFGRVLPYIEYIVMYDLQWRIKRPIPKGVVSKNEKKQYINEISNLLKSIGDMTIMNQKQLSLDHKLYALSLKYNKDITGELSQFKTDFYFNNLKILSTSNKNIVKVGYVDVVNNKLHIEGFITTAINKEFYEVYIEDQEGTIYEFDLIEDMEVREKKKLEGHYYYDRWFKIDIPIGDGIKKIRFKIKYKDNNAIDIAFSTTDTCRLNTSSSFGFLKLRNNIIETSKNVITVRKNSRKLHLIKELKFCKNLIKNKEFAIAFYRIIAFLMYYIVKRDIWIISDRPDVAGDNGEAFFKFIVKKNFDTRKIYFAISKESPDYDRMKQYGKVVDINSMKYKILFLAASKIISSQASDYIINAFDKKKRFIKDMYRFDFIFLQHGILKDDLSSWLNKSSKDIRIFVTSGKPEYDSLLNGNYHYGPDIVKLTGMTRYDYLTDNKKEKKIAIIPTWRHGIPNCVKGNDESVYNPAFKETEFYKFYNELINHPKLIKAMQVHGYTGTFCLHPLFKEQASHFKSNKVFEINNGNVDYNYIFTHYSLLLTDYSSVFFDFGYLYKPTVYVQFDKEEFFNSHSYSKGYFDYETDGFGPVTYNVEDAVNNIINTIMNGCVIDDIYKKRIDKFFPLERGHNCENVYQEIIKTY